MKKKCLVAYLKSSGILSLYLIINMLAIIGTTVYLSFYNDAFYDIMYDIFINNGDYNQIYDLIAFLVAPTTTITGIVIVLIYLIKSLIQKKTTIKKMSFKNVFLMISIGYVANVITSAIVEALPKSLTTTAYADSINLALSNDNFIFLLISTGIAAPILEEIIFRDWINSIWSKINILAAMIISSLFFGLAHMNLVQSTYAFVLGMLFAYINKKYNSILPGIIMHLTVNSSSVILETYSWCANLWYIPFIICLVYIIYTYKDTFKQFISKAITIVNQRKVVSNGK